MKWLVIAALLLSISVTANEQVTGRVEYTKFYSESLGKEVNCAISLPASYETNRGKRYAVVYFLPGMFNSERDWESKGMQGLLEQMRSRKEIGDFIVAIPYGGNSFYLNGKDGTRYEDAIVKDFIKYVETTYRTIRKSEGRVIEGLSMGGFGALLIGFKHPELFAGVAAHSSAIFEEPPAPPVGNERRGRYRYELGSKIFGAPADIEFFKANNPLYLAKANASRVKRLKVYIDIGEQDEYGFQPGNNLLSQVLKEAGIQHEYALVTGGHGWTFLVSRGREALLFDWSVLKGVE